MQSQAHSSISSRLPGWNPASWNPSVLPHANTPFFWLLPHAETSGRLKWWTESCLNAIEGKVSHVSIWNMLRLASCWNKVPSLQHCQTVCLKLARIIVYIFECSNPFRTKLVHHCQLLPSPGVVKYCWHRISRRKERLWYLISYPNVHCYCLCFFFHHIYSVHQS